MSSRGPGIIKRLWFRYKALRLPWRRQFLVGADLSGNTFWEFRDQLNAGKWRRIVKYSRAPHYADVKISPQWHQWLRHTREDAPTIQEQQYDVSRQEMMKELAAKADERWRSIPSYLDSPQRQQPVPAIGVTDSKPADPKEVPKSDGVRNAVQSTGEVQEQSPPVPPVQQEVGREVRKKREKKENPWNAPQQGNPGEGWQPQAWTPGPAQRRG